MKAVTIVGGGLAGLVLGIRLRGLGVPVTIYEKRAYPQHRVCGEFISGVSGEILEKLNLVKTLEKACSIPSVEWFIKDRKVFEHNFDSSALGMSRYTLDRMLSEKFVREGGDLIKKKLSFEGSQEGLVWAAGKPMNRGGKWIGLSLHLHDKKTPNLEMHSGPGGYVGLSPIENDRTNVTGLFQKVLGVRGQGRLLFSAYLRASGLESLAKFIDKSAVVESSFCAVAGFEFGSSSDDSRFSIGDASTLIPPFVGNGMSMAIESADIAAEGLLKYSSGDCRWDSATALINEDTSKLFSKRMFVAKFLHPFILSGMGLRLIDISNRMKMLPIGNLYRWTR